MKVFTDVDSLQKEIAVHQNAGCSIGFVPTMGALHQGHVSLVNASRSQNDRTVVSIFVNPKQFNDLDDLNRYPRTPEKDRAMLAASGCDILFMPGVKDVYPEDFELEYELGYLDQIMEGKHRKGHFRGVVTVVHRLFSIVKPNRAYFGEKDYQQLVIIRTMTRDLGLPVIIVPCPIVREPDGLAMSSRNRLLTPEQRAHAPLIAKTLRAALQRVNTMGADELKEWVRLQIDSDPFLKLEYFELADAGNLMPVTELSRNRPLRACIAVWAGKIRLIDNLDFS